MRGLKSEIFRLGQTRTRIWVITVLVILDVYIPSIDGLPSCSITPSTKGFNEKEKKAIVDMHNKFRQQVVNGEIKGLPRAKEMLELQWDKSLEDEAQRWADLCPSVGSGQSHPPNDWKKFPYGQNVAWGHQTVVDSIQDWIDEYKPYVAKNVDPLIFRGGNDPDRMKHNLGDLGHFTAIVTAKTNKIGCALVKDLKLEYKVIYVCNYSPPGNIIFMGQDGVAKPLPAYEIGTESGKEKSSDSKAPAEKIKDKIAKSTKSTKKRKKSKKAKKGQFRNDKAKHENNSEELLSQEIISDVGQGAPRIVPIQESEPRPWQSQQSHEQMFNLPQGRPLLYPDVRPIAYTEPGFRPLKNPGEFDLVDSGEDRPQIILPPGQINPGLAPGSSFYQPSSIANLKVMENFDKDFLQSNQDVLEIFRKYGKTPKFYVYNNQQAKTRQTKTPAFLGLVYNPFEGLSRGTPPKVYRFFNGSGVVEEEDGSVPVMSKTYKRKLGTVFKTGQFPPYHNQGLSNPGSVIFPDSFPVTFPETRPSYDKLSESKTQAFQPPVDPDILSTVSVPLISLGHVPSQLQTEKYLKPESLSVNPASNSDVSILQQLPKQMKQDLPGFQNKVLPSLNSEKKDAKDFLALSPPADILYLPSNMIGTEAKSRSQIDDVNEVFTMPQFNSDAVAIPKSDSVPEIDLGPPTTENMKAFRVLNTNPNYQVSNPGLDPYLYNNFGHQPPSRGPKHEIVKLYSVPSVNSNRNQAFIYIPT